MNKLCLSVHESHPPDCGKFKSWFASTLQCSFFLLAFFFPPYTISYIFLHSSLSISFERHLKEIKGMQCSSGPVSLMGRNTTMWWPACFLLLHHGRAACCLLSKGQKDTVAFSFIPFLRSFICLLWCRVALEFKLNSIQHILHQVGSELGLTGWSQNIACVHYPLRRFTKDINTQPD